jgi:CubicO group peptidase (beta-lactamase class C family)
MAGLSRSDGEGFVRAAGFAVDAPVTLAAVTRERTMTFCGGVWPGDRAVVENDEFYAASLTKQLTGAAIALLAREGRIDPDMPVAQDLLPRWTALPTVRQLLHHIAGLPAAGIYEVACEADWTDAHARSILVTLVQPATAPGTTHTYSNFGYILLARIVERSSGMPFSEFVEQRLLLPLGITGMRVRGEDDSLDGLQTGALGPLLPRSTGDGGLWTTAGAYAHWLDAQNHDRLGVAALVQQDVRLADGQTAGYGWGIGLRRFRGHALYIHGGGWAGTRAKAVRCPALGLAVVALANADTDEPVVALVDAVLNRLADETVGTR